MRFLIYDPICEGRLVKKDDDGNSQQQVPFTRRAMATCLSFIVSGILHEVFIIYLRGRISGYWLAFFSVQGPLVIAESFARRLLRARCIGGVPKFISIPATLGLLLTLGDLLFFPDVTRMGIVSQILKNLSDFLAPSSA